jgi:hypothetical protein
LAIEQQKSWWDWTDEELAMEAQASMRGQGALVESMRRPALRSIPGGLYSSP